MERGAYIVIKGEVYLGGKWILGDITIFSDNSKTLRFSFIGTDFKIDIKDLDAIIKWFNQNHEEGRELLELKRKEKTSLAMEGG